jgi:hypothetical protein
MAFSMTPTEEEDKALPDAVDDDGEEVEPEGDDDGDADDGDDEPGLSRKEKKQARANEHAELRRTVEQQAREMAEMRGRLAQIDVSQQRGEREQRGHATAEEAELERIDARSEELVRAWKGATEEDRAKLEKEAKALANKRERVNAKIAFLEMQPSQQQMLENPIYAEFGDVCSNERAFQHADGRVRVLQAAGTPRLEAVRQALAEARNVYQTSPGARPPASATTKARVSGAGAGGAGTNVQRGEYPAMTKPFRQAARALFPDLPERKAYAKYQKEYLGKDLDKEAD